MARQRPFDPLLLIISGPAGSGKTTLCTRLLKEFPGSIERMVTTTSRDPRPGERDGVDYHFLAPDVFERRLQEGAFIEWAKVHGRYYGSQSRHLRERLDRGKDLLLNIDVQGVRSFREHVSGKGDMPGRLYTVFIKPRSLDQLRGRLIHRGSDDEAEIRRRLETAAREIREAGTFDTVIVSGTMEEDYAAVRDTYLRIRKESTNPTKSL